MNVTVLDCRDGAVDELSRMIDPYIQVQEGDCIFIPGNLKHALYNTGEEELHMMFVYAPSIIVDHWAKEQSGEIK